MRFIDGFILGASAGIITAVLMANNPHKVDAQGPVRVVEIYGHQQTVYDDGQGEYTVLSLRTCKNLPWGGKHCDSPNTKMYIGNVNGLPSCIQK